MRRLIIAAVAFTLVLVVPGTAAGKPSAPITIDTTAVGHVTRTSSWDITKTVTPEVLDITIGGSATASFEVSVTRIGFTDVSSADGAVCVANNSTAATDIVAITDTVEYRPGKGKWQPLATVDVDLGGNSTIASGGTQCYPYVVEFVPVDGADYRNVAEVSSTPSKGKKLGRVTSKTTFTIPDGPDVFVNDTISVDDSNGMSWQFTDTGTETYSQEYTAAGTFTNTATIVETGQSASATVTVNELPGCSTPLDAVAYWCFDDEANPTADGADGHDATLVGPVFDTGDIAPVAGNVAALALDGIDDYGSVLDPDGASNLDGFDAVTLAAWIKPDVLHNGGIVTKYNSSQGGAAGVSWGIDMHGDDLRFVYSWDEFVAPDATLIPGVWQHVAGTWDGHDVRLYVDGVLVGYGESIFETIPDTNVPVNIGAFEGTINNNRFFPFDGLIDEAYIFDRSLAPAEIASLAGAGSTSRR